MALVCAGVFSTFVLVSFAFIFTKSGRSWYRALLPVVNGLDLLAIVGRGRWWIVLLIFPATAFPTWLQINIDLARRFGRSGLFGVCSSLVPLVFLPVLGLDSSCYSSKTKKSFPVALLLGSLLIAIVGLLGLFLSVLVSYFTEPTTILGGAAVLVFLLSPGFIFSFGVTAGVVGFLYSILCLVIIMRRADVDWKRLFVPVQNLRALFAAIGRPSVGWSIWFLSPVVFIPVCSLRT